MPDLGPEIGQDQAKSMFASARRALRRHELFGDVDGQLAMSYLDTYEDNWDLPDIQAILVAARDFQSSAAAVTGDPAELNDDAAFGAARFVAQAAMAHATADLDWANESFLERASTALEDIPDDIHGSFLDHEDRHGRELRVETPIGDIVCMPTGDAGIYDEVEIDLVKDNGDLLQIAVIGTDNEMNDVRVRDGEPPSIHIHAFDGMHEEPAQHLATTVSEASFWYRGELPGRADEIDVFQEAREAIAHRAGMDPHARAKALANVNMYQELNSEFAQGIVSLIHHASAWAHDIADERPEIGASHGRLMGTFLSEVASRQVSVSLKDDVDRVAERIARTVRASDAREFLDLYNRHPEVLDDPLLVSEPGEVAYSLEGDGPDTSKLVVTTSEGSVEYGALVIRDPFGTTTCQYQDVFIETSPQSLLFLGTLSHDGTEQDMLAKLNELCEAGYPLPARDGLSDFQKELGAQLAPMGLVMFESEDQIAFRYEGHLPAGLEELGSWYTSCDVGEEGSAGMLRQDLDEWLGKLRAAREDLEGTVPGESRANGYVGALEDLVEDAGKIAAKIARGSGASPDGSRLEGEIADARTEEGLEPLEGASRGKER